MANTDLKIDPEIREDIRLKMGKIRDNPKFYDSRRKAVNNSLIALGDVYSFWIEHPELRRQYLTYNLSEETIKKKAKRGIRAIIDGWYFLLNKGRERDFVDTFDLYDLEKLNSIVYRQGPRVDDVKPGRRFRKGHVTLNAEGYNPPNPDEIVPELKQLFRELRRTYHDDPLETAIHAHLGIAAIQPFDDGNKRCARLVQNRILFEDELPPSIIPAGEGRDYLILLCRTLKAYGNKDIDGQRDFYNFNASKVNSALDEILDDLQVRAE